MNETIGNRVKRMRQKLDISQEKLASESGCSSSTITRMERGLTVPDTDTLDGIARALGTTTAELLGDPLPAPRSAPYPSLRAFLKRHAEHMKITEAERRWLSQPLPGNQDIGSDDWWMGILILYRQQLKTLSGESDHATADPPVSSGRR